MIEFDIFVAAIASMETKDKTFLGDRSRLESDGLVRNMFDELSVEQIHFHLEGQLLPRLWSQGKVYGILCKPKNDVVVGLYGHDDRDVLKHYETAQLIDSSLKEIW